MKSKYKLSGLGIIIIIIMLIFLNPCIYRAKAADTVRLKNGVMEISSKRLSAQISFGYKGNTKYGKRMKVCAVINNKRISIIYLQIIDIFYQNEYYLAIFFIS